MKLYKILSADGYSCHGGSAQWALPTNGQHGEWMPPLHGSLNPCVYGYHLCRPQDLVCWLGETIYEAEYRGAYNCGLILNALQDNKVVVTHVRLLCRVEEWNERTARLFAADCAEHVIHVFEREYPNDKRPRQAITAARLFASDNLSRKELAAARAAARAAAWDAARDAEREWQTEKLLEYLNF